MANGLAKQNVINKFYSDNSDLASETWDQLNLDSVPYGMDHMILSYALETSIEEALTNVERVYEGYSNLKDYLDSNYMTCASDYKNMASIQNEDNEELVEKITKIFNEACVLNDVLGFTSTQEWYIISLSKKYTLAEKD